MSWFKRRDNAADFAEAIRPELAGASVPSPSPDLLARIIASRTTGARVILPDVASTPSNKRSLLIPAVIAAGMLLLIVPVYRSSFPAGEDPSSLSRIATEWLPGSILQAQSDALRTDRKAPAMTFTHANNIQPKRLEYLRTWRDQAQKELTRMNGVITLEHTMRDGIPSFLVVSRNEGMRNGRRLFTLDSVEVARTDLRPLHHSALERPYSRYSEISIDQTFRSDSVVGRMRAMQNGKVAAQRPIARKLALLPRPIMIDALAPVTLGAVDIRNGWSGSASMLGWAVRDDDVSVPIELRVDGADLITVPAGRYDCWRLSIRFAGRTTTYWVRKSDGVGVRGLEKETSGATREAVLVKG
jgi:hypothetical protein